MTSPKALRVALLVLASALAVPRPTLAAGPAGCTLADGAPWAEYLSRHFVLDVAGDAGDPAALVGAFEELHAAVLATLTAEPVEIPGRVRVVVLPRQRDLFDYTGSTSIVGLFWVSQLGEPTILVSADQVGDLPMVIAHELAHHLSSYLFPDQPYWFAEGLAQFVEGVAKVDGKGRRWAGSDPAGGFVAGSIKLPRMASLVGGDGGGEMFTSPFLASWILYRYLWSEHGPQLSTFQQQLMEGIEPRRAWSAAFPQWDLASRRINRLDHDLTRYQNTGRGVLFEVKPAGVERAFTARPPALGDLHLSLLRLRLFSANQLVHERLRRQALEEAAREDPGHPAVIAELASLDDRPRLPALQQAAARRPADGRGWYLLGLATVDPAGREAAFRAAVAAWPDGALAQAALATQLASTGRARAGLPFANRAVELAPWSPTATAALAAVALGLSKCKEALALQERALAAVDSHRLGSLDGDADRLRAGLQAMRQRCDRADP